MTRILVVEDEESFSDALSFMLRKEGFTVSIATTGPDALTQFEREPADLILLDLMLPGMSGTDVCRTIRTRSRVPIIMVTAKDSEIDKVLGLELGADDYVTKPYSSRELLARVKAILRRGNSPPPDLESCRFGDIEVDFKKYGARKSGRAVHLTRREYSLLRFLIEHSDEVASRSEILDQVWGDAASVYPRTVDTHVGRLRKKLEDDPKNPRYIVGIRGVGYRFDDRRRRIGVQPKTSSENFTKSSRN